VELLEYEHRIALIVPVLFLGPLSLVPGHRHGRRETKRISRQVVNTTSLRQGDLRRIATLL
jgi:hypothetical protein